MVEDEEMLELVEMEMRELLDQYEFEEDTPIIRGSALGALNGVKSGKTKFWNSWTLLILDSGAST
jgi:elongation factor Tu